MSRPIRCSAEKVIKVLSENFQGELTFFYHFKFKKYASFLIEHKVLNLTVD